MTSLCHVPGCVEADLRLCYFCPNVSCAEHGTINANGVMCGDCTEREREKREQALQTQQAAVGTAQASQVPAKGSGCLSLLRYRSQRWR